MKKTALALTIILALLIVAIVQICNFVRANPVYQKPGYDIVSIQSPQNKTYNTDLIPLNFTCRTDFYPNYLAWCYTLDGNATILYGAVWNTLLKVEQKLVGQVLISDDSPGPGYEPYPPYTEYIIECNSVLPPLSDGLHNVTVYRGPNYEFSGVYYTPYTTGYFQVDTSPSPSPSLQETETQQPEPFPTTLVVASVAIVAFIGLGLLVYFKKRKH